MTPAQLVEIARISNIFAGWSRHLRLRAEHAKAIGYGIEDSFSQRIADELQGAVDSLNKLSSLV